MNLALGELVVDFENLGRPEASLFGAGTPRTVLAATATAAMMHGRHPSLRQIIESSGLPSGTLRASRSRVRGLREAMDTIGRGPLDYFATDLAEEIGVLRRFWRGRTPAQVAAWEAAAGCLDGLHRLIDREDVRLDDIFAAMPAQAGLTRLWGSDAPAHAEYLDLAHRLVVDPPEWAAA